jgi:flagellar biosynthesis/type III secretory pathway chaperone
MPNVSHFETLTERYVLVQQRTETLISDLRRLVHLIEADIKSEEERVGIFNPTRSDYPVTARQLKARWQNLTSTISRLEQALEKRPVVSTT